ncbi:putative peptidase [Piscirickettsia salmonis]|uniref:aminopeptidase P family protein n=1 Tax=Piscirickettsia salmonis TaxID=1238 RepID=UPI0012BA63B6|nr:aminopeptidase P family protein [Piscirickettsia salmonis]QGP56413.1 putative peptidase [Piscirickettsia salmonis]QGP57722.1 putative peptidase [Piscirickettsia salmonis]QGP65976.1 putative peptidase [Piscirickettsia salmonis]
MHVVEKLQQLRQLMKRDGVDAYYIPMQDPHNSEYLPLHWQRLAWLSGFTGSAATVIVTQKTAILWTDCRYFLQAENELDLNCFELFRQGQPEVPTIAAWLAEQAAGFCLGADPQTVTIKQTRHFEPILNKNRGTLKFTAENYIDQIWLERPALLNSPVSLWSVEYAGKTVAEKLGQVREQLIKNKVESHVLTTLDAVAWLFNIRGADMSFNPVVVSYALVEQEKACLYIDQSKLTEEQAGHLAAAGVSTADYDDFANDLQQLTGTVWLDVDVDSYWVLSQLNTAKAQVFEQPSPIHLLKACKNSTEVKGMHQAHHYDGLALVRFFHWLERHWQQGVSELAVVDKLLAFRKQAVSFQGNSFATISGFAEHGAIMHYRVSKASDKIIDDSNLFLLDSGGQYLEGTTDVTRTIHLGQPTAIQKKHYTLVLKGHLQLEYALFPQGTTGTQLDTLARYPLWQEKLNFGHGTGHGVGCYLNVHEGPQRISPKASDIALELGMVVSNEPGLYLDYQYGIRIENLCVVTEKAQADESLTENIPFYGFDSLTLVPYARNLIDVNLLSDNELNWLNNYHRKVYARLAPELTTELQAWLAEKTAQIIR